MCGRFNFPKDSQDKMLHSILENLEQRNIQVKTGDIFPGDIAAVIANNRNLEPHAFAMEWGYKMPDGKRIINARSETASHKAMFTDGMLQRRCLIPAAHYYEWQNTPAGKVKYTIAPKNSDGFFLAGIYRLENGVPVFSVLTRDPVESIAFIHNRMPVILPQIVMDDWLNPRYRGEDVLRAAVTEMQYSNASSA